MKAFVGVLVCLSLAACVTGSHAGPLIKQVAFDEGCTPESIHVVEWGPYQQSAWVDACGKRVRYNQLSEGVPSIPNWVQAGKGQCPPATTQK